MSNGPARDESGRISWLRRHKIGSASAQGCDPARNVPVEADFKVGQPLGKVGRAPDLPVGELACRGGNKAVRISFHKPPFRDPAARTVRSALCAYICRNALVFLAHEPPVAVDDERDAPRVVGDFDPKVVVEPVVGRDPVNVCGRCRRRRISILCIKGQFSPRELTLEPLLEEPAEAALPVKVARPLPAFVEFLFDPLLVFALPVCLVEQERPEGLDVLFEDAGERLDGEAGGGLRGRGGGGRGGGSFWRERVRACSLRYGVRANMRC